MVTSFTLALDIDGMLPSLAFRSKSQTNHLPLVWIFVACSLFLGDCKEGLSVTNPHGGLFESNWSIGEDSLVEDDYSARHRHLLLQAKAVAHKREAKEYFLWRNYKDLSIYNDGTEVVSAFSHVSHQMRLNHLVVRIVTGVEEKADDGRRRLNVGGPLQELTSTAEGAGFQAAGEEAVCIAATGGGCFPVLAAGCLIAAFGFLAYVMYENTEREQQRWHDENEAMSLQEDLVDLDECEWQVAGDDQVVEKYADLYLKGNVMDTQDRMQDIKVMLKANMEHHQDCVVDKSHQAIALGTKMAVEDDQRHADWQHCWAFCGPEPLRRVPKDFHTLSTDLFQALKGYRKNINLATQCSMPDGQACSIQMMDMQLGQLQNDFGTVYHSWRTFKQVLCDYCAPFTGGQWDFCRKSWASPTAILAEMNKLDQHQFATHSPPVLGYVCLAPAGIVFGLVLGWACKSKRWRKWQTSETKTPLLLA